MKRNSCGHKSFLSFVAAVLFCLTSHGLRGQTAAIPATFEVTTTGAATYSIPLEVAPGTNGLQPQLTITYNSLSGIGNMGYKWTLCGTSAITRVPQSRYYDGDVQPVDYLFGESYALDGQRLVRLNTPQTGVRPVYGLEIENHSRIAQAYGTDGIFFVDTMPDGHIAYYGLSANSQLFTGQGVVAWLLAKVIDAYGNTMDYTYSQYGNEALLSRIDYTYNTSAQTQPYAHVELSYIPRTHQNDAYVSGGTMRQSRILSAVKMYNENRRVRSYRFSYSTVGWTDRLMRIDLLDNVEAVLSSTEISWDSTDIVSRDTLADILPRNYVYVAGNFNSDGHYDLIGVDYTPFHHPTLLVEPMADGTMQFSPMTCHLEQDWVPASLAAVDMDNDGKDEILYRVSPLVANDRYYLAHPSTDSSTYLFNGHDLGVPQVGDYDGDGRLEIVALDNGSSLVGYGISGWADDVPATLGKQFLSCYSGDFDGDDKADLLLARYGGYSIYSFNIIQHRWEETEYGSAIEHGNVCSIGDFNGDGLADLLLFDPDTQIWYTAIRTGRNNWITSVIDDLNDSIKSETRLPAYRVLVLDLNGDGKSDIVQESDTSYAVCLLSDGVWQSAFHYLLDSIQWGRHQKLSPQILSVGDFDRNGLPDILFNDDTSKSIKYFYPRNRSLNLVRRITDALGRQTVIDYAPISLLPDQALASDIRWMQYPLVSRFCTSNGIGGLDTTTYYYGGVQYDTAKHAFLGFSHIGMLHRHTFTEQYQSLLILMSGQTFPMLVTDSVVTRWVNAPPSTSGNTYAQGTWSSPSDTVLARKVSAPFSLHRHTPSGVPIVLPYPFLSNDIDYLHNVSVQSIEIYDTTTWLPSFRAYDHFNRVTSLCARSDVRNYAFEKVQMPNGARVWKPSMVIATQMEGVTPNVSLCDTFSYHYQQGYLNRTVHTDNGGTADTTSYTYNPCGLPLSTTQRPHGEDPRTTTVQYDSTSRFVVSTTQGILSTSATFDHATGNMLSETTANGLTTTYTYDAFGRTTAITRPDRTQVLTHYFRTGDGLSNAVMCKMVRDDEAAVVTTYYDVLGREVHRHVENQGYYDIEHDARGLPVRQTLLPYPTPGTQDQDKIWQTTTYDHLDRPIAITSDIEQRLLSYPAIFDDSHQGYYYEQTTDQHGATSTRFFDAANRLIRVVDNGGQIDYEYGFVMRDGKVCGQQSIAYNGDTTLVVADSRGNRVELRDPDAGTITSTYDGWNQLRTIINGKGDRTNYSYDNLGRVIRKACGLNIYRYDYYTNNSSSSRRKGLLSSITSGSLGYRYFYYDTLGRLSSTKKRFNSTTNGFSSTLYTHAYTYDDHGRLYTVTYPDGYTIRYEYDNYGRLAYLRNHATGFHIYDIDRRNALGQPLRAWFGNETGVAYRYDRFGRLTALQYGYRINSSPRGGGLRDQGMDSIGGGGIVGPVYPNDPYHVGTNYAVLKYSYNGLGMLSSRHDSVSGQTENYLYDEMGRLTQATFQASPSTVWYNSYAPNGNMLRHTMATTQLGSNYGYDDERPHAVKGFSIYGSRIPSTQNAVTYNNRNRPSKITEGGYTLSLAYGEETTPRTATFSHNGNTYSTVRYISTDCEYETTPSYSCYYDYIYAEGKPVAIHVSNATSGLDSLYYIHTDHLGSWERIVDADRNVVQASHFSPWGCRMKASNWRLSDTTRHYRFRRGFTGHEHYDAFRIINTGARLYDPVVARFFSPDPQVQNPFSTQSLNRYSYCGNNPVMNTDPDGEFVLTAALVATIVVSAGIGAYYGYKTGVAKGATGWGLVGYSLAGATIGGVAGFAGGVAGATVANAVGVGGLLGGAIVGGIGGAFSGGINGAGFAALSGGDGSQIAKEGLIGALSGMASGAFLGGISSGLSSLRQGNGFWTGKSTESSIQRARRLGVEGEKAANVPAPKDRIESLTGTAKYRIPDGIDYELHILYEVKNVKHLNYTAQLRVFILYCKTHDFEFRLVVREHVEFSTRLESAIEGLNKFKIINKLPD
ncbi:MAG: hypothetical protein IJ620_05880 [Bacteroidales bacterium]|nr:hypothetical protein [Bacteroidales bacterium]